MYVLLPYTKEVDSLNWDIQGEGSERPLRGPDALIYTQIIGCRIWWAIAQEYWIVLGDNFT